MIRVTIAFLFFLAFRSVAFDAPYSMIEPVAINESSGLVLSRTYPGVVWTHNDSGDSARIFAITIDGKAIRPENADGAYAGFLIVDAHNIDWEDIATDGNGNLIIAACGNNGNARKDLALYVVKEPDPRQTNAASVLRTIRFRYPDQTEFPPVANNFDCEALFAHGGKYYVLTKHRADTRTQLYRFDTTDPEKENIPTLIGVYDIGGMVTAAEMSPDGKRLAVLTYGAAWIFEPPAEGDNFLAGRVSRCAIVMGQCEGICFDGEDLIVSNEQRGLYRIEPNRLQLVIPPIGESKQKTER